MAKNNKKSKKSQSVLTAKQKIVLRILLVVIGAAALASLALASFTFAYRNRLYPNSYIGGLNLGGKNINEARDLLTQRINELPDSLSISTDKGGTHSIALSDIDLTIDTTKTVAELYAIGRVGTLTQNLRELLAAIFSRNVRSAEVTLNTQKLEQELSEFETSLGTPARDAALKLASDGSLSVTPSATGFGIAVEDATQTIRHNAAQLTFTSQFTLTTLQPHIHEDQVANAQVRATQILEQTPLTLIADTAKLVVTRDQVFGWFTLQRGPQDSVATLAIDAEKVKPVVTQLATSVDREPADAQIIGDNGSLRVVKDHVSGAKLNVNEAVTKIRETLGGDTPVANAQITLPVTTTLASIRSDNLESLGIKELIGHAETNFKGSPNNRVHNIKTGASFLNGIIIKPGEEFSTVKTLGAVDNTTGYLPELVIKNNSTIPEYGGGLCQVSTTLFRSVLNAGLKVLERQNHSYRVSYYEPPLGLDATIYLPKPDFRFLNDTPGHILVQSKVEGTKITFDLYGVKDGRVSSVSDTTAFNYLDPPAPIYVETDTLPKGEVKQIEKPHQGVSTVVTYVVTRDGQEINRQVFRSKYQAWAARFLVGTRE